jgi:lysophospholipase L1-like esterase
LLGPQAECLNFARGGQSSKSFLDQKLWLKVLWSKPQYILIQFGHNDMPGKGPERETDPQSTYPANLARYVHEARAAGAIPILITPMVRRNFMPDGTVRMELAPWADAARKVAKEKQAPLVDLNALSAELVAKLGPDKAAEFNPESKEPGTTDRTHLSKRGAEVFARIIADELKQAEPNLAKLLK